MTQTANNYGTVLFELGITKEIVEKTKEIFELTSELPRVLNCPVVSRKEKHRMIERFFPQEIHHFLKELCDHEHMDVIEDVLRHTRTVMMKKTGYSVQKCNVQRCRMRRSLHRSETIWQGNIKRHR